MAEIKGTNIASPVVPFTDQDIYATHYAKYGHGGYRTVKDMAELNSIPAPRIEEGMLVYVIEDPSGVHTYQFLGGKWVRNRIGNGIPIYTQELIEELGISPKEDEYISIPSKDTDLDGSVTGNSYTTTTNGTYVDVLFQAIRALQSEVAKLKNSFTYGIESYTGKTTAMSRVEGEYEGDVDEEPLWAIEEDGLSQLGNDITIGPGYENEFAPAENVTVRVDEGDSYDSFLTFNGSAKWTAGTDVTSADDSKIFIYLTTNGLGVNVGLTGYTENVADGTLGLTPTRTDIDLSKIQLARESSRGYYNILVVISRNQKLSSTDASGMPVFTWTSGQNFVWISIGDPHSDQVLAEGYWSSENKLFSSKVEQSYHNILSDVTFTDLTLSKFNLYSKYQDFSKEIAGTKPSDESYKFKAAHITIRSVEKQADLSGIKDQILNNELIWVEDTGRLWIKTNNILTIVGGGSGGTETDTGMTKEEMIEALKEMGIVQEANGDISIQNLDVEDITFIHQASGRRYKFGIDETGALHSQELADESKTFAKRIANKTLGPDVRGFIGQLRMLENNMLRSSDAKLYSDRLKIGAFYAPFSSDIVHGCSHSYIELENTSDVDIPLKGCYLHFTRPNEQGLQVIYHLELTGIIPAGGTYLVRGAQHAELTDPNVYLKVDTFDQEWYYEESAGINKLVSLEIDERFPYTNKDQGYGIALTYGNEFDGKELSPTYQLYKASEVGATIGSNGTPVTISSSNKSKFPYVLDKYFIDGIYYHKTITNEAGSPFWAALAVTMIPNSIYRNTFELDPAKQAFQAFTTADSSRVRWANASTDIQVVSLEKEYIAFPHSEAIFPISNYTPKASFQKKNVSTDKTKLDVNKPNMVTSSFGIDIYKTRCFNWISVGYYDEYVWVKPAASNDWVSKFQSYTPIIQLKFTGSTESSVTNNGVTTYTTSFTTSIANTGGFSGAIKDYTTLLNSDHKAVKAGTAVGSLKVSGVECTFTLPGRTSDYPFSSGDTLYLVTSDDDYAPASSIYPSKKFFNGDVTNNIYARITGRFPADNSFYTAHKVILDIVSEAVTSPTKYTYVVGRADKNGNPDLAHCSEEMSFTLYPKSYRTQIYQITDQQGFHWIEYQVWAGVANKLKEKIEADQKADNIIPILVNTGDMTQNGTRINEWYDYYEAGKVLFDHLEQMNTVGNNDLCGTDPKILGTGDDTGKSTSYYFHLFYCYEVDPSVFTPLVKSIVNPTSIKYVPSLYYFDSDTDRFLVVNSELTETTCKDWFGLTQNGNSVNIYTGFEISSAQNYCGSFTSVYSMVYAALNTAPKVSGQTTARNVIAICHEMPFTVITSDSLLKTSRAISRSISNASALVGSHMNQISPNEADSEATKKTKGLYWFSRLLEYFKVKLCIGGHKHTYACTYPLRENYKYKGGDGTEVNSYDAPMPMEATLENDYVDFYNEEKNTSKFPYTKRPNDLPALSEQSVNFYPCEPAPGLVGGVTYFMCQASGYKLTSNKELPSSNQKFSRIIPETISVYKEATKTYKDTASPEQKYPMFAIIQVNAGTYSIKLARVTNIFKSNKFTQTNYSTGNMGLEWLQENSTDNFGTWNKTTESELISIL